MKVCFKNLKKANLEKDSDVIRDFCQLLQDDLGLKKDIQIKFVNDRDVPMTTGVRRPHHEIIILAKNRMLVDILRTLAHEWVHEYQYQVMGIPENKKIQDIGGPVENMASILASVFLKKFQKRYPDYDKNLFNE